MKIMTAAQMARIDAYTMECETLKSIDLMERAAEAFVKAIKAIYPDSETSMKVFAGSGNNGGDAMSVARRLFEEGYKVEVFFFNISHNMSPNCSIEFTRLKEVLPLNTIHEITLQFEMPNLCKDDVIIDGLFGTGLSRPLQGGFALLVKFLNRCESKIISLDVPSGLMCEDNTQNIAAHIVQANHTLTLQCLKPSFMMPDIQQYLGRVSILDIGLNEDAISNSEQMFNTDEFCDVKTLLKPRPKFGHKGTFGHGLLIAGSQGMAGAAILAARACMKSGIGKLTLHTPKTNNTILQTAVPEVVLHHDEENYYFANPIKMDNFDALAIGPGLGTKRDTAQAFIEQVSHTQKPLVIDADAFNILADHKGWIQQVPKKSILTPHPKEFSKLFGPSQSDYEMLMLAMEKACTYLFYIVLKGHYTAICTPEGKVYFNTTGNSGMATAGSGDALTGILLSLLSQGYGQLEACQLGTYLHGLAGDLAAEELTEEGMTVNDLIHYIPYAIKKIKE